MNKWDYRFIKLAHDIATWSKDPIEGVGAVLVSNDRETLHHGYNGFPKRIEDDTRRLHDRPIKNSLSLHAEINVLLKAQPDISDWTLYLTKPPCMSCACALAQKSPAAIFMPDFRPTSSWYGEQLAAYELLQEAGIDVRFYNIKELNHEC